MTALLLSIVMPFLPPSLHAIPPEAMPYIRYWRNEPTWIQWYSVHQDEENLWDSFIGEVSVPAKDRQRAWQVKKKLDSRR